MKKDKTKTRDEFIEITKQSWTWQRLTADEQNSFLSILHSCNLRGAYHTRWRDMQKLYSTFLGAHGYIPSHLHEESKISLINSSFDAQQNDAFKKIEPQKIKLDLGFASLVVEVYNSDYPVPEMIVCLENKKSIQDIAIIRQAVNSDGEKQVAVECLVYSDMNSDDYTHKFKIGHHKEEE